MTDAELQDAINRLTRVAAKGGNMHPLWDLIIDAQANLNGKRTIQTREQIEAHIKLKLRNHHA